MALGTLPLPTVLPAAAAALLPGLIKQAVAAPRLLLLLALPMAAMLLLPPAPAAPTLLRLEVWMAMGAEPRTGAEQDSPSSSLAAPYPPS
jgi:hypothetical protein